MGLFSRKPPKDWLVDETFNMGPCYVCGEPVVAHKWERCHKNAGYQKGTVIPIPNHSGEYMESGHLITIHFRHYERDHPDYDGPK